MKEGYKNSKALSEQSLIERLRTRASIRRNIKDRKSVKEGKPDRIADLLEESADELLHYEIVNWKAKHAAWCYDLKNKTVVISIRDFEEMQERLINIE